MPPKRNTSRVRREKHKLKMRQQRADPIKRRKEQIRDVEHHRLRRSDPVLRKSEKRTDRESRRRKRSDPDYRAAKQQVDTSARRITRSDTRKRALEQLADTEAHREKRSEPILRVAEQKNNTSAHRVARSNPIYRKAEQEANTLAHRVARSNPIYRKAEQKTDASAHRVARSKPIYRKAEQEANTLAHRKARTDPVYRKAEQEANTSAHRITRSMTTRRSAEQLQDTLRRRTARSMEGVLRRESRLRHLRKVTHRLESTFSYQSQLSKFNKKIQEGPTHVCSCCGRLWYKTSITRATMETLRCRGLSDDFIGKVLRVENTKHGLCITCWKHVKNGVCPKLALVNGFGLPKQPEELKGLSPLEERLVAARIPFTQIRAKGLERQSALRGNIVNVETDFNECAKVLPRQFNETSVVQVAFKRRLEYKHAVWNERIRPFKVYTAAKYLVNTPGYKSENVLLSPHWQRHKDDDSLDFVIEEEAEILQKADEDLSELEEFHNPLPENRVNLGAEETLIYDNSVLLTISIAPGENKIPIPLSRDLRAEELSFPCTWCGVERQFNDNLKISLTDVKRSDIMQFDRRASTPQQVLYAFRRSNNEQIKQQIQVCLRRRKGGEIGQLTAGNIKTPGFVDNLVQVDDGYMVFKNIRNSPAYWKAQTKRVVAMIRQKGKCSFFLTLSAAETKWPELLVMLMKLHKGRTITPEDAMKLTFEEKAELIRSDPVTCMRHFDYKFRAFLNEILRHEKGAFNPRVLSDFFSRFEFQVRGSPHSHGLIWIKDAPEYVEGDLESEQNVIKFIDEFITCTRDEEGDMEHLIAYQIHNHSATCKKGRKKNCRFNYPKPPMPETKIMKPLPKETSKNDKTKFLKLYAHIQEHLNSLTRNFKENIPFDGFLEEIGCCEDDYFMAVRSTIKRDTIFLKRETSEIFVNAYNKKMLTAWRANMDIQFVLDTYACAKYCVGYVMKAESGVSKLLQAAEREIRNGNYSIREKMCKHGSALINGPETSAQEAVAYVLGMPMTRCSRTDVFINTSPVHERVSILKPNEKLQTLDDEDDDIFEKGLLDHYVNRPVDLEKCCLAEFASMYNFSTKKPKDSNEFTGLSANDPEDSDETFGQTHEECETGRSYKLIDGSGYVKKRKVQKIIRFRNYSKALDVYNYWREQLMLFTSWRDEENEFGGAEENVIAMASEREQIILNNARDFYANRFFDDRMLHEEINDPSDDEDDLGTKTLFEALDIKEMEDYTMQFLSDSRDSEYNRKDQFRRLEKGPDSGYYSMMQSLNEKQRRFVMAILHEYKVGEIPFRIFLSGGAGVGKSHVISAIIQSIIRHDELFPSQSPEDASLLVCAPTGKAAFNVKGMTVHSTFLLPPTQSKKPLLDLQAGTLNTLRLKFKKVKVIIIDEVSMLSSRDMFNIDQRLRQIFGTSEDFGGRSVLLVGHLRQLPPVMASYVFADPNVAKGTLVGNYLWKKFKIYEFDEIQRQKGDYAFCKALNNMAEGIMDDEDVTLIQSREISDLVQPPSSAIRLFFANKDCQEYNLSYHNSLHTDCAWSYAFDRIEGQGSEFRKRQLLYASKDFDASKSDGVPYHVHLQVGAAYFISTNIDVKDGLYNGSSGTLMRIDYSQNTEGNEIPTAAWLLFDDESVGSMKRGTTRNYQISKSIPLNWTLIERTTRNLSKLSTNALQVIRTQLPLVAANGMTIHKSQGSTMQNVVVNIGKRGLKRELLYVACSRAKSIHGLFINGGFVRTKTPSENDPVTIAMNELRQQPMNFPLRYLQDYDHKKERLYFHNIQSFLRYKNDLESDHSSLKLKACTLMILVEPHISSTDNVALENYDCVSRVNSTRIGNATKSDGILAFRGKHMSTAKYKHDTLRENGGHFTTLQVTLDNLTITGMYRHKNFPIASFNSAIERVLREVSGKAIFVGDINIDMLKEGNQTINIFQENGFTSKLDFQKATTNGGTTIDVCFSNENVEAWLMETYYSYHKSICVVW